MLLGGAVSTGLGVLRYAVVVGLFGVILNVWVCA